ncbi:type II CRISPR RNA-guided endonuclease Cas9 [Bacteroidetes/Chlorobi group bacterium ChocPot_Mid]|nr:MAG: type II CRISPR RNA-guided endonuclease Cas9 [Bacteroidetes/Chlorobi group bacterium ChocPot_Mid]
MSIILGLDLGPNSIGWALIDSEQEKIISSGVRIFQEGVNNLNKGKEESKNATRRTKREIRVQNRRRRIRRQKLIPFLKELNLMPNDNETEFFKINPYEIRKKALYSQLSNFELGRVFFHLNQRRGFRSNRKTEVLAETAKDIEKEKETGKVKTSISNLEKEIKDGGFITLGEYLASLNPHEKRIRDRYTNRDMYLNEFDIIWEKQSKYYPDILTQENKSILRDQIIFYQRPLKSQRNKVGKCLFEPNHRRAAKSNPIFQEFRMLQQINSLTIYGGNRIEEHEQKLTFEEREKLIEYLSENYSINLDKPKTLIEVLGLDKRIKYRINLESYGKVDGLKTYCSIKKALGKELFSKYNDLELYKMWDVLYFATDREWLKTHAIKKWHFNEETAEKFSRINLEDKFGNLSTKAMRKMLPYLREGKLYHEAAELAGYKHSFWDKEVEIMDLLPEPEQVANPIVMQTLHQVKKVVNELIETYKKPDIIRVELGRDMKQPLKKRLEIEKINNEIRKKNNTIRDILIKDFNIERPTRDDIIKYKLWEECKFTCPYTGRSISKEQLFDSKEFEVEHIIPYSHSLDNSFMNLTLCEKRANEEKGNMTPYEYFLTKNIPESVIKQRVKHFPQPKARKFFAKEIEIDFINRQLNDTRYASKLAKDYLKHITPEVTCSTGSSTALLRYYWGLNSILSKSKGDNETDEIKNREDHRHHAIDAIVIACTDHSKLQRLSTYHGTDSTRYKDMKEDEKLKKHFPYPWKDFRNDIVNTIQNIIVSHRLNIRVSGALHEEILYGKLKDAFGNERMSESGYPVFAVRKTLKRLTQAEIHKIIDPEVKATIIERLEELGIDVSEKKFNIPKNAFAEPIYLTGKKTGIKTQIKSVRVERVTNAAFNIRGYNLWVEPGNNHHIIIFSENGKVCGKVVTLFEAYQRRSKKLPIIDKNLGPDKEFLYSLRINDLVIMGDIPNGFETLDQSTYHLIFDKVYRVRSIDRNNIIDFRKHFISILETLDKNGKKVYPGRLFAVPSTLNCKKIVISPIGIIEFSND